MFSMYDQSPIEQIGYRLGGHSFTSGLDDIYNLSAVCIVLCDRVYELTTKVAELEKIIKEG